MLNYWTCLIMFILDSVIQYWGRAWVWRVEDSPRGCFLQGQTQRSTGEWCQGRNKSWKNYKMSDTAPSLFTCNQTFYFTYILPLQLEQFTFHFLTFPPLNSFRIKNGMVRVEINVISLLIVYAVICSVFAVVFLHWWLRSIFFLNPHFLREFRY